MGRLSQQTGSVGEDAVSMQLALAGFEMIERVIVPVSSRNGRLIYLRAVSGDFRAVWPGKEPGTGISVLVEAKAYSDTLPYSALKQHQRESLDTHHKAGGISILAWHNTATGNVWLMRWPVAGFVPRSSLKEPLQSDF